MPASRKCNDCGVEYARTAEHWHKNPTCPDGLNNICKRCAIERVRDYCRRNRDKVRDKEKKRRDATADERREYQKIYRAAKTEELRKKDQRRYVANRQAVLARVKQYRAERKDQINSGRRAYRSAHPEELREKDQRRYAMKGSTIKAVRAVRRRKDPENFRAEHRKSYAANREKHLATTRKWAKANPEKARAIKRKHYDANTAKAIARAAQWRRDNPDKDRAHATKSRARRALAPGSFSAANIQAQREKQNGLCFYCQCDISKKYHIDHYVPIAKGGTNDPSNIVLACPPCNVRKQAKLPEDFTPPVRTRLN